MRAGIYARKSKEDAKRPGKSVRDQIAEARAEITMRGYELDEAHVYADDGISASRHARRKARPGYAALVQAIEAGELDVLVMAEQSRASRRLSVIGALVELCQEHGVRMVMGGRDVDPSNPTDLMIVGVTAGMDAAESERTRERILRATKASAKAGRPAGKHQFGYRRVYDPTTGALQSVEIVPEEAAIIREMVSRALSGDALAEIARDLNARGILSPYDYVALRCGRETQGALWVGTQVRRIIVMPAYAGKRVHHGVQHDAIWPAIITQAEHERITAIMSNPARRTNASVRPGAVVWWLSGVAKCGRCGAGMRHLKNRGRYGNYTCMKCYRTCRAADKLEGLVEQVIFRLVRRPDTLAAIAAANDTGSAAADTVARLDELTARRDNIRALIVAGTMPPEDGAAMLAQLGADIQAADEAVKRVALPRNVADVVTPDLEAHWGTFSPARKREIADALLDITVLPAPKGHVFDPQYVLVQPKGTATS